MNHEDRVFINGGSGGMGVFQFRPHTELLGCHVTTCCSGVNVEFCRLLRAHEVLDRGVVDAPQALIEEVKGDSIHGIDLVMDNVGRPWGLYKAADRLLAIRGNFISAGTEFTWAHPQRGAPHQTACFVRRRRQEFLGVLGQPNGVEADGELFVVDGEGEDEGAHRRGCWVEGRSGGLPETPDTAS